MCTELHTLKRYHIFYFPSSVFCSLSLYFSKKSRKFVNNDKQQIISALHIYCRIHEVNIPFIQLITQQLNCFAKTLEMDDFTLPQELDDIVYIRVIGQTQNVIVSGSRFLLCCYLICTT